MYCTYMAWFFFCFFWEGWIKGRKVRFCIQSMSYMYTKYDWFSPPQKNHFKSPSGRVLWRVGVVFHLKILDRGIDKSAFYASIYPYIPLTTIHFHRYVGELGRWKGNLDKGIYVYIYVLRIGEGWGVMAKKDKKHKRRERSWCIESYSLLLLSEHTKFCTGYLVFYILD